MLLITCVADHASFPFGLKGQEDKMVDVWVVAQIEQRCLPLRVVLALHLRGKSGK